MDYGISEIFNKIKNFISLIFHGLSFENNWSRPSGELLSLKFCHKISKVTFWNPGLTGFRMIANNWPESSPTP